MRGVLLVYPPGWIRFHPVYPLGIATLGGVLADAGIPANQLDLEIEAFFARSLDPECAKDHSWLTSPKRIHEGVRSDERTKRRVRCIAEQLGFLDPARDHALVAFSIMGERQYASSSLLAALCREEGIQCIAGGEFITRNAEWAARRNDFDQVMPGALGSDFIHSCQEAIHHRDLSDTSVDRVSRDLMIPLSQHPMPVFSAQLRQRLGSAAQEIYKTKSSQTVLQYQTDTGCTSACCFCYRHTMPRELKSPAAIARELKTLSELAQTRLFSLVSNALNMDKDWSTRLLACIGREAPDIEWYTYANPTELPSFFDDAANAGCKVLRFGVESGSDTVLRNLRKGFTAKIAGRALHASAKAGIWNQVNFMIGTPHETGDDVKRTIEFIANHGDVIDSIRINPFYLQLGSPLHETPNAFGIRIREQSGRTIGFDEIGGLMWEEKIESTIHAIDQVFDAMRSASIAFHGISSNLLLCVLHEKRNHESAKMWMNDTHPYTAENLSFESIRWRLYHPKEAALSPFGDQWSSLYGLAFEEGVAEE